MSVLFSIQPDLGATVRSCFFWRSDRYLPLTTMSANPLAGPSPLRDIINPQFHQNILPAENFIKSHLNIKLDKGSFEQIYASIAITKYKQTTRYVDCRLQPLGVHWARCIVLYGIPFHLLKISSHRNNFQHILGSVNDWQLFANIGFEGSVRKEMLANFCMNTT